MGKVKSERLEGLKGYGQEIRKACDFDRDWSYKVQIIQIKLNKSKMSMHFLPKLLVIWLHQIKIKHIMVKKNHE